MKRTGWLSAFLLGLAVAAQGQGGLWIGPHIGTTFGPDAWGLGSVVEREATVYGGQAVLQLTDAWSLELSASTFEDWDDEERFGIYGVGDGRITPVTLTARYAIPLGLENVRVYGGAGIGWYFYDSIDLDIRVNPGSEGFARIGEDPRVHMEDVFGYHVAGGVQWFIRENWELFIEYRYAMIQTRGSISDVTPLTPQGEEFALEMRDDYLDNDELPIGRFGVNYRFWTF